MKKTENYDKLMADVNAAKDKAWAEWLIRFPDILRIAGGGFDFSDKDRLIVRGVFSLVAGTMHQMIAEFNDKKDKLISEVHDK